MKSLLFAVMTLSLSARTFAQEHLVRLISTGSDLKEVCHWREKFEPPTGTQNLYAGMCIGYISGVLDYEAWTQLGLRAKSISDTRSLRFCVEDERITRGQIEAVIRKFADEHPEVLHLSAAGLISGALSKSFPCTKIP